MIIVVIVWARFILFIAQVFRAPDGLLFVMHMAYL